MSCEHANTTCRDSRIVNNRTKTPKQPFGYIRWRRLICLDCGHRFNTYEVTVEQVDDYLQKWISKYDTFVTVVKHAIDGMK